VIAEADLVLRGDGESLVRILDHPERVAVPGAVVVLRFGHGAAQKIAETEPALKPAPAKAGDVAGGGRRIERKKPVAPAERKPEGEKPADLRGRGRRRKAGDAEDAQVHGADPGLEAAEEVSGREEDIEVARHPRDADRLGESRDTRMEVAKKRSGVEALELEAARQGAADLVETVLERKEDLLPRLSGCLVATEEVLEKSRLRIGRREVGDDADQRGLEVESRLVVLLPPFVIDELEDGVREGRLRWKLVGRIPDRVQMNHPGVAQKAERAVDGGREMVELLGRRGLEVRTPVAPAGEKRAVLVEDHSLANQGSPVEEVGKATVFAAVVAEKQGEAPGSERRPGEAAESGCARVSAREVEILVSDAPEVDPKHLGIALGGEDEKRMDAESDQSRDCDGQDVETDAEEEGTDESPLEDRELPLGPTKQDGPGQGGIDPVAHQRTAPPSPSEERTATASTARAPPKMIWERRRIPWE
jgi:hypothetical protein